MARAGLPGTSVNSPAADDFGRLVGALLKPTALIELGLIAVCLVAAWALVRLWRGPLPRPESIWFGDDVVDGLLFPVAALVLVGLVRWVLIAAPALGVPVAVFKVVVPILASLVLIRLTVRVLGRVFPSSPLMRVVERSVSWLAWLIVVLWVTGLLPLILRELDDISWKVGASRVSLRNLLEGAVTAGLVMMVVLWVSAALETRLLRGATTNLSVRKMAANALRVLLVVVGLIVALSAAGIDVTALGVLGGAIGVGIGLGLQKLAANYVSGFVILAENSMRIGDLVKVDNFEGRITDISTRYTVILANNGRESIVPNEMMITQRVENASLADTRISLGSAVRVAYGTDLDTLMPQLQAAVAAVPRVLANPPPTVLLTEFAADGLDLSIGFWISDVENGESSARSAVNLAVLKTLNAAGVEIPFPQRVLRRAPA